MTITFLILCLVFTVFWAGWFLARWVSQPKLMRPPKNRIAYDGLYFRCAICGNNRYHTQIGVHKSPIGKFGYKHLLYCLDNPNCITGVVALDDAVQLEKGAVINDNNLAH